MKVSRKYCCNLQYCICLYFGRSGGGEDYGLIHIWFEIGNQLNGCLTVIEAVVIFAYIFYFIIKGFLYQTLRWNLFSGQQLELRVETKSSDIGSASLESSVTEEKSRFSDFKRTTGQLRTSFRRKLWRERKLPDRDKSGKHLVFLVYSWLLTLPLNAIFNWLANFLIPVNSCSRS